VTAVPSRPPATIRTVEIDPPGRGPLDLLPEHGGLAWMSGGNGLIGWGITARLEVRGPDRFARADAWWRARVAGLEVEDAVGLPGCGPVAFGSFAFDGATAKSVVVVPKVVVGVRDGRWWVTTIGRGDQDPLPRAWSVPRPPGPVRESGGALSPDDWMAAVGRAVGRIDAGEVGKVVLARDVVVRTDGRLDPRWPLHRLAAAYPSCWTFAVDGLLGATPELLVRLEGGRACSRVLAGTLRRDGDPGEYARLAGSAKDVAEHEYGVRSVVEALAPHCGAVHTDGPSILRLPNVLHLATDVTAEVTDGSTSLDLLASLHPSAAVCGSPTTTASQVIRAVEGMERGRYAGPVGWMDAAGDGEWGIALRSASVDDRTVRLFAGCGIVADSDPEVELAETKAKAAALLPAVLDAEARPS
jgi:menaquinone-specific isochorismate synthase